MIGKSSKRASFKSGWSIFEIGKWFKLGFKPIGERNYDIELKEDNGLCLSYLSINQCDLLINFGKWQKEISRAKLKSIRYEGNNT